MLSIGVLWRPLCFARIHETRCLWSVFKFLWFEDFNLLDVSRQFKVTLALLNETSMCPNGCNFGMNFIPRTNISIPIENLRYPYLVCEKGFPRFSQVLKKSFLAYPTGISMNPTGARKYCLTRGSVRRLSWMMSGHRL